MVGKTVLCTAGREKDKVMMVVGITEDNLLLLADGKERRLNKPKRKKFKHLQIIGEEECVPKTDRELRAKLNNYLIHK